MGWGGGRGGRVRDRQRGGGGGEGGQKDTKGENQHTRELINTRNTSHKYSNKDLNRLR